MKFSDGMNTDSEILNRCLVKDHSGLVLQVAPREDRQRKEQIQGADHSCLPRLGQPLEGKQYLASEKWYVYPRYFMYPSSLSCVQHCCRPLVFDLGYDGAMDPRQRIRWLGGRE